MNQQPEPQNFSSVRPLQLLTESLGKVPTPIYWKIIALIIAFQIFSFFTFEFLSPADSIIALIVSIFSMFWMSGTLIYFTYEHLRDRNEQGNRIQSQDRCTIGDALRQGLKRTFPLILGFFLYLVGSFLGIILLIIPGIFVSVRWFFLDYYIVINNRSAWAGMGESWNLTRGRWWNIFFALLVITVFEGFLNYQLFRLADSPFSDPSATENYAVIAFEILTLLLSPINTIYGVLLFGRLARPNQFPESND